MKNRRKITKKRSNLIHRFAKRVEGINVGLFPPSIGFNVKTEKSKGRIRSKKQVKSKTPPVTMSNNLVTNTIEEYAGKERKSALRERDGLSAVFWAYIQEQAQKSMSDHGANEAPSG